jgi:hypothetical protein
MGFERLWDILLEQTGQNPREGGILFGEKPTLEFFETL